MNAGGISVQKIIWALDAFEADHALLQHAIDTIHGLKQRFPKALVQPVYVFTPGQFSLSSEIATPYSGPWLDQFRPAAEKALATLMKSIPRDWQTLPPRVLTQGFSSNFGAVKSLIKFSNQWQADLIVSSSHGRKGLKRLVLGSFSESLVQRSPVPVIVVGPRSRTVRSFERILFPTQFGKLSKDAFRECIGLAKSLQSKVTLFHALPHPFEPVFQAGVYLLGGNWIPAENYYSHDLGHHERHVHHWVRYAQRQGVECDQNIQTEARLIATSIVQLAIKYKHSMICMEMQSGPWMSALLGSITKQVLRSSPCPVVVLNSAYLNKAAQTSSRKRAARIERKAA